MLQRRTTATLVFIFGSLGLAWLVALPLWIDGGLESPQLPWVLRLLMLTPAVAVVAVMLLLKPVPGGERLRFLGLWPLRPAKRVVWFSVLGLFVPFALTILGLAIAALLGWLPVDLERLTGFRDLVQSASPAGIELSVSDAWGIILVQALTAPFVAATFNAFLAFGEEVGWRGFLVPALRPLGTWPTLLLSGAVWGLWHAPLVLLGYNFQRPDWGGVALMVSAGIAWGVVFGWLRLRSGSVWPAVFAHGMLNTVATASGWFIVAGASFDLALAGPLGVASWIACGLLVLGIILTRQLQKHPPLASRSHAANGSMLQSD